MTIIFNYPAQQAGDNVYTDTAGALREYCVLNYQHRTAICSYNNSYDVLCIQPNNYSQSSVFYMSVSPTYPANSIEWFQNVNFMRVNCLCSVVHDYICTCSTNVYQTGYLCAFNPYVLCYKSSDNFRIRIYGTAVLTGDRGSNGYQFRNVFGFINIADCGVTCCVCIDIIKSGTTCCAEFCVASSHTSYSSGLIPMHSCVYGGADRPSVHACSWLTFIPNCIEKISGTVKWLCCF